MNDNEVLNQKIVDLLYDLHSFGKLNSKVLESISRIFEVDAFELCEEQGITYFIN